MSQIACGIDSAPILFDAETAFYPGNESNGVKPDVLLDSHELGRELAAMTERAAGVGNNTSPGARLRTLMLDGTVVAPFVWDGAQARLAMAAGHTALYLTGFGTAASHGVPDIGLIGLAEMEANARRIVAAVDLPVIADADTGYGGPASVTHTVRRLEATGVAAIHIEDQVWPKRCGFLAGKQVIPLPEMLEKLRAALAARSDPDFLIIGRTDALAPLGWDEAMQRARAFCALGVDLVFVDGLGTREEIERAASALADIPRVLNSSLLSGAEAEALGYGVVLQLGVLRALFGAMRDTYAELADRGQIDLETRNAPDIETISHVMGLAEYEAVDNAAVQNAAGDAADA